MQIVLTCFYKKYGKRCVTLVIILLMSCVASNQILIFCHRIHAYAICSSLCSCTSMFVLPLLSHLSVHLEHKTFGSRQFHIHHAHTDGSLFFMVVLHQCLLCSFCHLNAIMFRWLWDNLTFKLVCHAYMCTFVSVFSKFK